MLPIQELEVTSQGLALPDLLATTRHWSISTPARKVIESDFVATNGVTYRFGQLLKTQMLGSPRFEDVPREARSRGFVDMTIESVLLLIQKYQKDAFGSNNFMIHHTPKHMSLQTGQQKRYYRLLLRPTVQANIDLMRCNKEMYVERGYSILFIRA